MGAVASDLIGELEFAGPAILNLPREFRTAWAERMAELVLGQAAIIKRTEAEVASMASPRAAGEGPASQGQGDAARIGKADHHD